MINTPMLFCRLCNAPNHEGLEECPICGTVNMTRQYVVTITMEVPVEEFGVHEAVDTAIALLRVKPDDYIAEVTIETDN